MVALAACSPKVYTASQADVDRMASKYPGYTLEELNKGKALFESNCNLCHELKKPKSYSEEKWTAVVPKMSKGVNRKKGSEVLDAAAQESILRYVLTMRGQ